MSIVHGRPAAYTNGNCRCPKCTAAATKYHAEYIAEKRRELAEHPENFVHGRTSTYSNYGCRCGPCTAAASKTSAAKYKTRKEKAS